MKPNHIGNQTQPWLLVSHARRLRRAILKAFFLRSFRHAERPWLRLVPARVQYTPRERRRPTNRRRTRL